MANQNQKAKLPAAFENPSASAHDLKATTGSALVYAVTEIDADHPVPISWDSTDTSTGYARILINKETLEILRMEMVVDGLFTPNSVGNSLQDNLGATQPFHFHNQPQGGPSFFVQQLFDYDPSSNMITTASLENTGNGLIFRIDSPYKLRNPINKPELGADFVISEIIAGNAYLGLHTKDFAIPKTPLAGDLVVLANRSINGQTLWLNEADDEARGDNRNDLLSLGAGNDRGFGGNGHDALDGGAGDDQLDGDNGDDRLWGGDANDSIRGGNGADQLFGARGNDLLIGGRGNDTLWGGSGADVFELGPGSGKDVITDFDPTVDSIRLTGGQRLVRSFMADRDGDGILNDTVLMLKGGELTVLNVDLMANSDLLLFSGI